MQNDKAEDTVRSHSPFLIGSRQYQVLVDHKNGWKQEAFRERYSEVLERYDYIVGDWGYNQLRLRGFFRDGNQKAGKDSLFSTVRDYLNEYCNFGCAYFIVERLPGKVQGRTVLEPIRQEGAFAGDYAEPADEAADDAADELWSASSKPPSGSYGKPARSRHDGGRTGQREFSQRQLGKEGLGRQGKEERVRHQPKDSKDDFHRKGASQKEEARRGH